MKRLDLAGKQFGHLTVMKYAGNSERQMSMWVCKCICGKITNVTGTTLVNGTSTSCGCKRYESVSRFIKKDSFCQTRISCLTACKPKTNTSGIKGISFCKADQKWEAYIMLNRKNIHLGHFTNKEDAIKARKDAEELYFTPILEKYKEGIK